MKSPILSLNLSQLKQDRLLLGRAEKRFDVEVVGSQDDEFAVWAPHGLGMVELMIAQKGIDAVLVGKVGFETDVRALPQVSRLCEGLVERLPVEEEKLRTLPIHQDVALFHSSDEIKDSPFFLLF